MWTMVAVHALFEGRAMQRTETPEASKTGRESTVPARVRPESDDRELQDLAAAYGPLMPAAFMGERVLPAA